MGGHGRLCSGWSRGGRAGRLLRERHRRQPARQARRRPGAGVGSARRRRPAHRPHGAHAPALRLPRAPTSSSSCARRSCESESEGWPGIRLAGESRELLPIGGLRKLVEYETAVDVLLAAHPSAGMLCRFDRRFFDDEAVAAMREIHPTELVTPALYDDTLLRVTGSAATALRFAGEIDLSNRPQVRRVLETALDSALRSPYATTDITIDLASLRFIDVAGAVELVHAAETFPDTHRLVLVGARPGVHRVLDRCGAPFAAAARGRPPRGGPSEDHQHAGGHPPPARRRVLRHRGRPAGPARAGGRGRARGGQADRARAAAHHRGRVARTAHVRPGRCRGADPPGRPGRPLRPDARRAVGPRAPHAHRGGAAGRLRDHRALGRLRRRRRRLLDRARRRGQRRALRPARRDDLLLPRLPPPRGRPRRARAATTAPCCAAAGSPTTPTTCRRRRSCAPPPRPHR